MGYFYVDLPLVDELEAARASNHTLFLSVISPIKQNEQLIGPPSDQGLLCPNCSNLPAAYQWFHAEEGLFQDHSHSMGLEMTQVIGHYYEELTAFSGWRVCHCEGGSVGLARLQHQGTIKRKENLFSLGICGRWIACDVCQTCVEVVAEAEKHHIGKILTEFREVFLNPRMYVQIVELKHLDILQVVEFCLQEFQQEWQAFFLEHLVRQFCVDEPMDVESLSESVADGTAIAYALGQVDHGQIGVHLHSLLLRVYHQGLVGALLECALFGQTGKAEGCFDGGCGDAPPTAQLV